MNKQYLWGDATLLSAPAAALLRDPNSFLPLPRVPLLTQLHHVATSPLPRYHGALKFDSPSLVLNNPTNFLWSGSDM